ncbi:MAG: hypothetical protein ACJ8FY_20720 [Gemmataceae bacterium]
MALEEELTTYRREQDKLLAHEGKFVLIHSNDIAGYWDTYEDALQAGYSRYKLQPFLVKRIEAVEGVQFFTRDVSACHS